MPIHLEQFNRVAAHGRRFISQDGLPFVWRGATAFRAIEKVARGRVSEVDSFFHFMAGHGVTVVRVLSMAANLFPLRPDEGVKALPRTLELARGAGLHVEVVGLADTRAHSFDRRAHIESLGTICAAAGNAFLEIANEPRHATQVPEVGSPTFLSDLRATVPASVLVALGAAHGPDDGSHEFAGGDYVTVHGARDDGDGGWAFVARTANQRALSESIDKPVVNDEPRRDNLAVDKHTAMAVLCRLAGLGDTFHFSAGLQADIPQGSELAALDARRRGWDLIPREFFGSWKTPGSIGSPVDRLQTRAGHVYASVMEHQGYVLALGDTSDSAVVWSSEWPTLVIIHEIGSMRLWHVTG
jgi:hypothetical protein